LRDYDSKLCLSNFDQLLSSSNLRFHLQDLLVRWFGSLSNPNHSEWLYLYGSLHQSEKRVHFLSALYGNAAWFHKLKSEGVISKWLSNGDSNFIENHVLYYLISLVENQQKDVAELLSAYADGDTVWLNRLFNVLSRVTRWNSYDAAELLEKVVYRLPTISRYGWYEIVNVAKAFPKIGCRLILYAFNYLRWIRFFRVEKGMS